MDEFTERDFRDALGQFATGVVVITAEVDGQRLGATISSFNAVSLTPPLILFSIARSAQSLPAWQAAKHYGVTVLAEHQRELSNRFAKSGTDKWLGLETQTMRNGAPLLPDWLACFECTPYGRYDGGDHEIFVGMVTRLTRRSGHAAPLVFYGGKYRSLADDFGVAPPGEADIWLHGW
jgi:flavin reductase (DIM6/NTAB) family NADH-FMN oxidoreductase RutF